LLELGVVDPWLRLDLAPLHVEARRGHRLLRRQAVVDHPEDRLEDRRADPVRARGAERHLGAPGADGYHPVATVYQAID